MKPARRNRTGAAALLCAAIFAVASPAVAGPWAEVGDPVLRDDIEVLAAAGLIDNITMQWPLPWASIVTALRRQDALNGQPYFVRLAAQRVLDTARRRVHMNRPSVSARFDFTNQPAVVRGFDALGRGEVQGQLAYEYATETSALRLAVGGQNWAGADHQSLVLDGSYAAALIGPIIAYAGYQDHWWGPGQISTLTLSNNARPMPQVGFSRADTSASRSPWLSWLGPWQFDFFVALMDGPRVDRNTYYVGTRLAFNPFDRFEIGISRTTQLCGEHHTCHPLTDYFNPLNDPTHINNTNDELSFDFKYNNTFAGGAYQIYLQVMNEDNNPIVQSGTNKLAGISYWMPLEWGTGRLTVEYADSVATQDIWGGKLLHGFTYNNYRYFDGMRYRGRTLGFSLDSDSRLISLQASLTDDAARNIVLSYHHAMISSAELVARNDPFFYNTVSTGPVTMNIVEARLGIPFDFNGCPAEAALAGRVSDDQPRPKHGATAAIELSLSFQL